MHTIYRDKQRIFEVAQLKLIVVSIDATRWDELNDIQFRPKSHDSRSWNRREQLFQWSGAGPDYLGEKCANLNCWSDTAQFHRRFPPHGVENVGQNLSTGKERECICNNEKAIKQGKSTSYRKRWGLKGSEKRLKFNERKLSMPAQERDDFFS